MAFIAIKNSTFLARSVSRLCRHFGTEPYGRHIAVYMPSGPILRVHEWATFIPFNTFTLTSNCRRVHCCDDTCTNCTILLWQGTAPCFNTFWLACTCRGNVWVDRDAELLCSIFIVGYLVCVSFPPLIGHTTLVTLCGFAYGMKGFFIGAGASLVGSALAFVILRFIFSEKLHAWSSQNQKWKALESVVVRIVFNLLNFTLNTELHSFTLRLKRDFLSSS